MNPSPRNWLIRCNPKVPLTVLAVAWLILLGGSLFRESQEASWPAITRPRETPIEELLPEFAAPPWPATLTSPPDSPFSSSFLDAFLLDHGYDARVAAFRHVPFDALSDFDPSWINGDGDPHTVPPMPPIDHLCYRGRVKLPQGCWVAFIENTKTGLTHRYRTGEQVENLTLRSIDRLRLELVGDQDLTLELPRRTPVSPTDLATDSDGDTSSPTNLPALDIPVETIPETRDPPFES